MIQGTNNTVVKQDRQKSLPVWSSYSNRGKFKINKINKLYGILKGDKRKAMEKKQSRNGKYEKNIELCDFKLGNLESFRKVTFGQRSEGGEEIDHVAIWGEVAEGTEVQKL